MSHDAHHGRFVWSELLTHEPERAVEFYSPLFGWTTEQVPMPTGNYTIWSANGRQHGGMMQMPADAEAPPFWLPYVGVDEVDGAALRCQEEGGGVHVEPRDIPGMGRFAVLSDPFGASFAVYKSESPQAPPPGPPPVGEFTWRELASGDIDEACAFYAEMFGWQKGPAHDMGAAGVYQLLARGDAVPIAGVYLAQPTMSPAWTSYVRVAELEAAVAAVVRQGGKVLVPPMEVPGGDRIAVCADPEGVMLGLHRLKAG
jgi:hypothetical protein